MNTEKRIEIEADNRNQMLEYLNKESSQIQIAIEYIETIKTETTLKWILSIAEERKNQKLYDCVTLLNKRFKKHLKLINDLKHYEHKATYYEMMYRQSRNLEIQNEILIKKLIEKGI